MTFDDQLAGPSPARRVTAGLLDAQLTLAAAGEVSDSRERYRRAHLAAVRAAVALLAAVAQPAAGAGRQRSVWSLLADRAPELTEWSWFLANAAPWRYDAAAGGVASVGSRAADDLVRQVEQFLGLVHDAAERRAVSPCAAPPSSAPPGSVPPGSVRSA